MAFSWLWPSWRIRVESQLGVLVAPSPRAFLFALVLATLVPLGVVLWATRRPDSATRLWVALLVQAVMLLNVAWHVAALVLIRGYSPGLITAVLVNLPLSWYVLTRALRERWLGKRAFAFLIPAAVVVHGPLLGALLRATGVLYNLTM